MQRRVNWKILTALVLGLLLLAGLSVAVLGLVLLPAAERLPGGAVGAYPGGALLLVLAAVALTTVPGEKQNAAARLLAVITATLMFIAVVGTGFRLLLALPALVKISLPSTIALLMRVRS